MEVVYTSGPGQNIDWEVHGFERALPQLFANDLNSLTLGEEDTPVLQMWNNNTPLTIGEWGDALKLNKDLAFNEFCINAVAKKNNFLRTKGLHGSLSIITDTDAEFEDWLGNKITRLSQSKRIYIEDSDFIVCNNCGNNIAEATARTQSICKLCSSQDLIIQQEKSLFLSIPSELGKIAREDFVNPTSRTTANSIAGMFNTLPPRVPLNKRREVGTPLSHLGFDGQVVNPKIAISLLPEYAAERFGISEITQIQSPSTATNTIPYTYLLKEHEYKNSYIFFNKGPRGILKDLSEDDSGFYGFTLDALSSRSSQMGIDEYENMRKDFLKLKSSALGALQRLSMGDPGIAHLAFEDDALDSILAITTALDNADFKDAYLKMRFFINKILGPKYARIGKASHAQLNPSDLSKLRTTLEPFFGALQEEVTY